MATPTPTLITDWLERLITADPGDRRMVAIEGLDAGIGYARIQCVRHKTRLNWQSAFAHLDRTEKSHRLQRGPGARLHHVGDLRAATAEEQPSVSRWATSTCRQPGCSRRIVWATTPSGRSMPVDADPDPAGNVVLTTEPGDSPSRRPLAVVLHMEFERAQTPPDSIHTSHMKTCRSRAVVPATQPGGQA